MYKPWCNLSNTAEDITSSVNCLFFSAEGLSTLLDHRVLKASELALPILEETIFLSSNAKVRLPLQQAGVTYGSPAALLRIQSRLLQSSATKGTDETTIYTMLNLTAFVCCMFYMCWGLIMQRTFKDVTWMTWIIFFLVCWWRETRGAWLKYL